PRLHEVHDRAPRESRERAHSSHQGSQERGPPGLCHQATAARRAVRGKGQEDSGEPQVETWSSRNRDRVGAKRSLPSFTVAVCFLGGAVTSRTICRANGST